VGDLYPDTALFWDTALWGEAEPDVPSLFWSSDTIAGYTLPPSHIDRWSGSSSPRGIHDPTRTELRYRGPGRDRLALSDDPMINPSGPIAFLTDEFLIRNGAPAGPTANTDPTGYGGMYYCAFGGPRWRHNANTTCNVAFADGSVRGLRLSKRVIDGMFYDNEFRRHMIMIKWPNNRRDTYTVAP
jgi:prepilin-type processing-associated H-X9-DG protein